MKLKEKLLNKRNLLVGGVAIFTLVTLTGCGTGDINVKMYDKDDELIARINLSEDNGVQENKSEKTDDKSKELNQKTEDVKKKDNSKEIVYAYVDDENTWTHTFSYNGREVSNEESYSFKIPQINIDSADAEKINERIRNDYGKDYEKQKEYIDQNDSVAGLFKIEYAYHINGDVLSVVMESFLEGDNRERSAYNINIKTGEEVTNLDLLKQKGLNESEFPSMLSNLLADLYKDMYTPSSDQLYYANTAELYNRQYNKTIDLSNCGVDNYMYLNVKGHLCVIVTRYNIAGGESTKVIIDIDDGIIYAQV